jgi:hypothetical protein
MRFQSLPRASAGNVMQSFGQQHMVSADGQRFLMNTVTGEAAAPITVLVNRKPKP